MFDAASNLTGPARDLFKTPVATDISDLRKKIEDTRLTEKNKESVREQQIEKDPEFFRAETRRVFVEDLARGMMEKIGPDRIMRGEFDKSDVREVTERMMTLFERYRKNKVLQDSFKSEHKGVKFEDAFGGLSAEEFAVEVMEAAELL